MFGTDHQFWGGSKWAKINKKLHPNKTQCRNPNNYICLCCLKLVNLSPCLWVRSCFCRTCLELNLVLYHSHISIRTFFCKIRSYSKTDLGQPANLP